LSDDLNAFPQRSAGDYAHTAARAALSMIPVAGGAAAELFSLVLASPLGKRRDTWLENLYRRLKQVEEQVDGFHFEDLQHNDAFVSAALQATQSALRTHQQEKLEALQNAVLNVALSTSLDEEKQLVFLGLIDVLSVTHLELLKLFSDRRSYPVDRMNQLRERRGLTNPMVLELNSRGLLNDPRPYVARTRESEEGLVIQDWILTPLGKEFLSFIAAPEPLHK
jgi:hypothetical protein